MYADNALKKIVIKGIPGERVYGGLLLVSVQIVDNVLLFSLRSIIRGEIGIHVHT